MKRNSSVTAGLLTGTALLLLASGCYTEVSSRRTGYSGRTTVMFEDDYDYYPGYEVYYSRSRHEYVYRDGNTWVRRPQPSGVSVEILLAAPSVRMDFRDAPELHNDTVVRSYPRNWKRPDSKAEVKQEKKAEVKQEQKDERNEKKDRKDDDKDDRKDGRR